MVGPAVLAVGYSRGWACCIGSRCGMGCSDDFSLIYLSLLLSPTLGDG